MNLLPIYPIIWRTKMSNWTKNHYDLLNKPILEEFNISESKAISLKLNNLPPRLYKYRCFDPEGYAVANFREDKVWMSAADQLNDPYDCYQAFDHDHVFENMALQLFPDEAKPFLSSLSIEVRQLYDRFKANSGASLFQQVEAYLIEEGKEPETAEKVTNALRAAISHVNKGEYAKQIAWVQRATKICALSTADITQAFLLWSHYSDQHRGFCIEYETKGFNPLQLHPIHYSKRLFDFTPYFLVSLRGDINPILRTVAALVKHKAWNYEREWRLLLPLGDRKKGILKSVPTPVGVYIGSKANSKDRDNIVEISKEKGIPAYQMELSPKEFRLIPKELG